LKQPVNLSTRGGDILTVDFSVKGDKVSNLSLTGPAKLIFKGEITI
jgi:diaminopimelate epimerase